MEPEINLTDIGLSKDDGSPLMNGEEMPDGSSYDREEYQTPEPTMTVQGRRFGVPER